MKNLIFLASALLLMQTASAGPSKKSQNAKDKPKLGTSFRFDGSSVYGKYQNAPGSTVTVENDKYIDDLLGARKNFDDRSKKERERN